MEKLNFKGFVHLIRTELLKFDEKKEFTEEDWNIAYQFHKDNLTRQSQEWKKGKSDQLLVALWAQEFYQECTLKDHSYELINKCAWCGGGGGGGECKSHKDKICLLHYKLVRRFSLPPIANAKQAQEFADAHIEYINWKIIFEERDPIDKERYDLYCRYETTCNDTGEPITIQHHTVMRKPMYLPDFLQAIKIRIIQGETHEIKEKLKIKGQTPYNEHYIREPGKESEAWRIIVST